VLGKFAAKLYTSQKVGSAIGDKFRVYSSENPDEYTEYQNFTGGYMKSVNGGNAQIIYRKNYVYNEATESYEEVPARGNATGYVGAVAKNNPLIQGGTTRETIYNKFVQAYEYFQNEKSFNIGSPFSIVKMTSKANFYSYDAFKLNTALGYPTTDIMLVAEGSETQRRDKAGHRPDRNGIRQKRRQRQRLPCIRDDD
jgi:hypothetical protein